jgi:hypothetical protein
VAVTEAKCLGSVELPADGQLFTLFSLELTYRAATALEPYVAVYGSGDHWPEPRDMVGAYATFASCLADLPSQSALFEGQTGLLPVSAACDKSAYPFSGSYVLRISGFGRPERRLRSAEFEFYGIPGAALRKQALDMLARGGGVVATAWGKDALYYSKAVIPVRLHRISSFEVAAQCEAQLGDLRAILSANGAGSVAADCLPLADELLKSRVSMEAVEDSGYLMSSDFGHGSPVYYSFEECMEDRGRDLEVARSRGRAPLGGICHAADLDTGRFIFEIYERL